MSKFDDYILKKEQMVLSENWASMIGKSYSPGWGEGFGHVTVVKLEAVELFYRSSFRFIQAATPYHIAPECLLPFLEESIKNIFSEIIKMALELQREDLKSAAISALKENEKMIEELKILEN